jgi:hypothetical protein
MTPRRGRGGAATRDRGAERDGTIAARPSSSDNRPAWPPGLPEAVRLRETRANRGCYVPIEAVSGHQVGRRCPCAQPHVGAGTPELCPDRLIPDGVTVYCSYWPDRCTTLSPRLKAPVESGQGRERRGLEGQELVVAGLLHLARPGRIDQQRAADRDQIELVALQPVEEVVDPGGRGRFAA